MSGRISTTTATAGSPGEPEEGLNGGEITGIVLGVILSVFLIGATVYFVVDRRKRKRIRENESGMIQEHETTQDKGGRDNLGVITVVEIKEETEKEDAGKSVTKDVMEDRLEAREDDHKAAGDPENPRREEEEEHGVNDVKRKSSCESEIVKEEKETESRAKEGGGEDEEEEKEGKEDEEKKWEGYMFVAKNSEQ